ncbi:MAG TPA: type II toxin-antitoxin system VapC family toxin [Thermoanaerobaculia bacterium]|nr:type II toxin-antitoxin system VapC family toxin [Thermoanaerobaculia bacterium]
MIAYLDTSVVLRIVLMEPAPLEEWHELTTGISSVLLRVESHCSLRRLHVGGRINALEYARMQRDVDAITDRLDHVDLTPETLDLATSDWPKALTTLDSIHLASATLYRQSQPPDEPPVFFATHDLKLAEAARAMNFRVLGV